MDSSCAPQKLLSYYSDKVCIYKSDCFIPLPTWRSCIPPPAAEYIVPMMLGPPDKCGGKPTVVPMPQPLNPSASYCNWMVQNMSTANNGVRSCCTSCHSGGGCSGK